MNGRERVIGCIVGGAVGDALGAPFEGNGDHDLGNWLCGPLLTTDDTQLTLATCEAIAETGVVDPATIADSFRRYFLQRRIRGIGASTLKALSELSAGGHWHSVGAKGDRSAGNGAAMRVSPLAFCLDPTLDADRQMLRYVCRITHQHDEAFAGALAIVLGVRLAASDERFDGRGLTGRIVEHLPDTLVRDRIAEFASLPAGVSLLDVAGRFGCGRYVVESVPLALLVVERCLAGGFEHLIFELIRCGGDSDTIASMAGNVAGAGVGFSRIPQVMLSAVEELDEILEVSRSFWGSDAVLSDFRDE